LFPRADNASQPIRERSLETEKSTQRVPLGTVLVVEDEDSLRQSVSTMLAKRGLSVIEAADGFAALEAIRARRAIDVLFLDITLPGAPSQEVLMEARRLRPNMKVIVTSAYTEEMAAALLQVKVEHFLRKPYRLVELIESILQAAS
jgi:two-component system, cell cycle sensor histidine kinase and response regulator CckA